jgi:hypothetical protein
LVKLILYDVQNTNVRQISYIFFIIYGSLIIFTI